MGQEGNVLGCTVHNISLVQEMTSYIKNVNTIFSRVNDAIFSPK